MSRNRVIYQSEALFVSEQYNSTGVAEHEQVRRVQSANYSFSVARQDVNQFGELSRIGSLVLESPTVSFDFSYYLTDGFNERALGFYVKTGAASQGGFASGHMVTTSGKNFYIATSTEGTDQNASTISNADTIIGLGNGFLSDYTVEGSVGALPTVSVSIEALNIRSDLPTGTGTALIAHPAVIPTSGTSLTDLVGLPDAVSSTGASEIIALKPGDIILDFGTYANDGTGVISALEGVNGAHVQSFSLNLPLSRTPLEQLGSKFAYARSVDFPVTASLSVNAIVNEITAKNLVDLVDDETERDVTITINDSAGVGAVKYTLKGSILQDESYSSSIGSNKSVDLTFTTQIGGPVDLAHNVLVSGASSEAIFV
jgi:hypothetical protein